MVNINQFSDFIKRDIWRIQSKRLKPLKNFWLRQLRIVLLAWRGFDENKCQLWASALTFYSLLSVVPTLAMAFGIAKGFGFEKTLEKELFARLPGQEEAITQIIGFANAMLENTKGGVIAGIGVVVLLWTVIQLLGNIEESFNDIWGVVKGRNLSQKFKDYFSMILICPILFIISSGITVMVNSEVEIIVTKIALLGSLSPYIFTALKILPYAVIWIMFTYIYIFIPNTRVRFLSGLTGGVIAGTIYQVVQWIYISFQIGVGKLGAVYGSFAALPLFLAWLQISWLIILLGAEICFAVQNVETYEFEPDCLKASLSFRKLATLRIAQMVIKDFYTASGPKSAQEISHALEIPIRLANQILFHMVETGLLTEVKSLHQPMTGYQPARDIGFYTIQNILNILDDHGIHDIPLVDSKELEKIKQCLSGFQKIVQNSPSNMALKDI